MIWFSSLYAYCLTKCVGQFRLTNRVLFSTLLTVHLNPIGGCSDPPYVRPAIFPKGNYLTGPNCKLLALDR
jgi:ABC-type multidrug transport system permease subunit